MNCPDNGAMRYVGRHQFVCEHGVWNVGGVAGSRHAPYAIGAGGNRHIPTIHAHLSNEHLTLLAEVKRLRTLASGGEPVRAMYGRRYAARLDEVSDTAREYFREHYPAEYDRISETPAPLKNMTLHPSQYGPPDPGMRWTSATMACGHSQSVQVDVRASDVHLELKALSADVCTYCRTRI